MTTHSLAWGAYHEHLREIAQLLRADPASRYGKPSGTPLSPPDPQEAMLSTAICRGALVLTCSHLQGFFVSVLQEFLERIDGSGIDVDLIPTDLKAHLCIRFPYPSSMNDKPLEQAALLHQSYSILWQRGTLLAPGTLRTDSLTDPSQNPRPSAMAGLLDLAGVDVFKRIVKSAGGVPWVKGVKENVNELVMSRNKIAHGDDSVSVTADDVRRLMQWATRFARASDEGLGEKLNVLTGRSWST